MKVNVWVYICMYMQQGHCYKMLVPISGDRVLARVDYRQAPQPDPDDVTGFYTGPKDWVDGMTEDI